jgi:hypothetical protein
VATTEDTVLARLGPAYVDADDFRAMALGFGCNEVALNRISRINPTQLLAVLAAASRSVDNFLAREPGGFSGDTIYENHKWDPNTRRIVVNQPPVSSLSSYVIRISPSLTSPFPVTPVSNDAGGNQVAFGSVYYNRQENFLELASFALAGSLTNNLAGLGMNEFSVEIAYKSYASVPYGVFAATLQTAVEAVNQYNLNQILTPGISKTSVGEVDIEGVVIPQKMLTNLTNAILSPAAARYFAGISRIAVG